MRMLRASLAFSRSSTAAAGLPRVGSCVSIRPSRLMLLEILALRCVAHNCIARVPGSSSRLRGSRPCVHVCADISCHQAAATHAPDLDCFRCQDAADDGRRAQAVARPLHQALLVHARGAAVQHLRAARRGCRARVFVCLCVSLAALAAACASRACRTEASSRSPAAGAAAAASHTLTQLPAATAQWC